MAEMLTHVRSALAVNFSRCIQGYHLINADPAKESIWESLNAQIFSASGCPVQSKSSGSHAPGSDITCAIGNISNKSAKYEPGNGAFSVSSYRLTATCSSSSFGTIPEIFAEISSRKNFQYYSIIVREETGEKFRYDWYLIPSDYPQFNPEAYAWSPMMGQRGKNKDKQIGWKTNEINGSSMSITFSMSSQLWMYMNVTEEMRQFIIGTATASREQRFNYLELYEMLNK